MESAPTEKEKINENELLKKEIEILKNEIKYLKENCIYKIKIDDLKPKDLCLYGPGKILDEYIRIEKDGAQYGPYRHYEQGKYLIIYHGDSLLNAELDAIDNGLKESNIPFTIINKTQNKISYEIIIPSNLKSGIEFRAFNKSPTIILVKNIEVFKYNI